MMQRSRPTLRQVVGHRGRNRAGSHQGFERCASEVHQRQRFAAKSHAVPTIYLLRCHLKVIANRHLVVQHGLRNRHFQAQAEVASSEAFGFGWAWIVESICP